MTRLPDQALITLYLTSKNERYFTKLYTRHRCRVYQRCLAFCKDSDKADDFTQEIFIRLMHKLEGFKGNATFSSWLVRITTNYCIDQLRKQQHLDLMYQRYTEACRTEITHEATEDKAFRVLEQVMQQLPTPQRELLRIKYEEGLDINTIATLQQLTPSAVKMRIKRSRDQAKSLYDKVYMHTD